MRDHPRISLIDHNPLGQEFPGLEVCKVADEGQSQEARQTRRLATLTELTQVLTTVLDQRAVAHEILVAAQALLPDAVGRYWERIQNCETLHLVASIGLRDPTGGLGQQFPLGEGLIGLAAASRQPITTPDVMHDSRFVNRAWAAAEGLVSCVMLPMVRGDRVHGVLAIFTRSPHDFTAEELSLLRAFAAHAAVVIENARLLSQLSHSVQQLQQAQDELVRSERLRALGQMTTGVAHDLNNILAAILAQTELLRLEMRDPVMQKSLRVLETAATDGAHVVQRLQDFTRLRIPSQLAWVDLAAVVHEALEMTRPRWQDEAQQGGHVIEVHTDIVDLPPILGHAAEVREVLTNVILNAVDAMPLGGRLALVGSPVTNGVLLAVSDNGTGMTEEVRQRIFEPFFTTKGARGTGLGLAVVARIMEQHQGNVQVLTAPGRGTTFAFRFQAAPKEPPQQQTRTPTRRSARRILLVDDNAAVRETTANLLRATGHTVVAAESGLVGLALLQETTVDVVITDLGMPEVTGWDVARAVKAHDPTLAVILLTGWGEHAATEAGNLGECVDRIVGKPCCLEELLDAVAALTSAAAGPGRPSRGRKRARG